MRSGFGTGVLGIHLLPVSARTICKDAEAELVANLDRGVLAEVVREATNWWQRIFNTTKGKKAGIERLRPSLGKTLRNAMEKISGDTERKLKKLIDKAVGSMEESCRESLEKRQDQLEALEKEDVSDEKVRERINKKIADVAEQRRIVNALKDEYEAAVASWCYSY